MTTINDIRTGDMIAFKKGKYVVAAVIHLFTNSDVQHVGIFVNLYNKMGDDFPFIIEANTDDVEYSFLPERLKQSTSEIYIYRLTDENLKKLNDNLTAFYEFMNRQIGKDYNYKQAVSTVFDRLYDKITTKDSYNDFFCSKLVGAIYYQAGIITPEMLKKLGFTCVSELTPTDCCKLPIFKDNFKLGTSDCVETIRNSWKSH